MLLSTPSYGLSFGMLKVHSFLEQPLDASISYSNTPADGVTLGDGSCIETVRDAASESGLPVIQKVQLQLEGDERAGVLRLRTLHAVGEPVAVIRLRSHCDKTGHVVREFTFFLDPQPELRISNEQPAGMASGPVNLPQTTAIKQPRKQIDVPSKEIWTVKRGDTLTGIARHFEPEPGRQKRMARAILASNPAIRNADLIGIGQKLVIPDLTVLYAANAAQPEPTPLRAERSTRPTPPRKPRKQAATDLPPPEVKHAAPATESETEFKVKLSPTQSTGVAGLQARNAGSGDGGVTPMGNADDSTAEMLALNAKIETLEQQMFSLKQQIDQPAGNSPATTDTPAATLPATPAVRRADSASGVSTEQRASEGLLPGWMLPVAAGVVAGALGWLAYRRFRR